MKLLLKRSGLRHCDPSAAPIPKNPAQHHPAYANILKMKTYRTIAGVIPILTWMAIFLAVQTPAQGSPIESGWKGIKAFVSTREDVDKLFGPPSTKVGGSIYQTPDGNIEIDYSGVPCRGPEWFGGEYSLPPDHIIQFTVYLKNAIPIEKLNWAKDRYRQDKSGSHPYRTSYYSIEDGTRISTNTEDGKEMVESISYQGTPEQRRAYKCPIASSKRSCI